MKYIFDLNETLISSTALNNDAYNYALEKFGYRRISKKGRITRADLNFVFFAHKERIIREKQKYFTSEWLPYRTFINQTLVDRIVKYGKENCYLWTKASKSRVESILRYCNLENLFNGVIFDDKADFYDSIRILKASTHSKDFLIYENDHQFFNKKSVEIIEQVKTERFNVKVYLIK